jgi:hypothetical protein
MCGYKASARGRGDDCWKYREPRAARGRVLKWASKRHRIGGREETKRESKLAAIAHAHLSSQVKIRHNKYMYSYSLMSRGSDADKENGCL